MGISYGSNPSLSSETASKDLFILINKDLSEKEVKFIAETNENDQQIKGKYKGKILSTEIDSIFKKDKDSFEVIDIYQFNDILGRIFNNLPIPTIQNSHMSDCLFSFLKVENDVEKSFLYDILYELLSNSDTEFRILISYLCIKGRGSNEMSVSHLFDFYFLCWKKAFQVFSYKFKTENIERFLDKNKFDDWVSSHYDLIKRYIVESFSSIGLSLHYNGNVSFDDYKKWILSNENIINIEYAGFKISVVTNLLFLNEVEFLNVK